MQNKRYIDLDRRFRELDPKVDPEQAALDYYTAGFYGYDTDFSWKQILEKRLVIILGEPGSGKTWELKNQAESLLSQNQYAFFIPLDRLIEEDLTSIIGIEDKKLFNKWKRSKNKATFFLDSVDESKARRQKDFYTALDRFCDGIGRDSLSRSHIIISSRITQWNSETDSHEVSIRFLQRQPTIESSKIDKIKGFNVINRFSQLFIKSNNIEEEKAEVHLCVFGILPLDNDRVKCFALHSNLGDQTDNFLRALDESHAWEFARRPIDVAALMIFWNKHSRLGTLTELIEFDLELSLKETEERAQNDPLTLAQAKDGAMALGAAVVFCRKYNFFVPGALFERQDDALDSSECLPEEWTLKSHQAMLDRGIFDGASYGRIRFHHRRVSEYLAAQWLKVRVEQGCDYPTLVNLLFAKLESRLILKPSLASMTAWLAIGNTPWQHQLRVEICESIPWLFLQYGDPELLTVEYKRDLLNSIVKHYTDRKDVWVEADHDALSRIADSELTNDVIKIINDSSISEDIRILMLRIISHGGMVDCLDKALNIVESTSESDHIKIYVVDAVNSIGDLSHKRRLRDIISTLPKLSTRLSCEVIQTLYPEIIDSQSLVELLHQTEEVKRNSFGLPWHLKTHVEKYLSNDQAGELLVVLNLLAKESPHIQNNGKRLSISKRFFWLGEIIQPTLVKLLEKSYLTEKEINSATEALLLLGKFHQHGDLHNDIDKKINFDDLTEKHSEIRKEYVKQYIEDNLLKHPERASSILSPFGYYEVLSIKNYDFKWMLNEIQDGLTIQYRQIILNFAINHLYQTGITFRAHNKISRAASTHPELKNIFREKVGIWIWAILKKYYYRYLNKFTVRWWWHQKIYKYKRKIQWFRDQWILLRHLNLLTSGKATGWLANLLRESAVKGSNDHWAVNSWDELRKKRGYLISWATKHGSKKAWPLYTPELPHEKANPNETDHRITVGLSGIQAQLTDAELDFKRLTVQDCEIAVRYALNEMNGFSIWFNTLAQDRPEIVNKTLEDCIIEEWKFSENHEYVHMVLVNLSYHDEIILNNLIVNKILSLLESSDPQNSTIFDAVLRILTSLPEPPIQKLILLAKIRVKELNYKETRFISWLAIWMQIEAETFLSFINDMLSSINNTEADDLMVRLCSTLDSRGRMTSPKLQNPDYLVPTNMRNLIPLVYHHIKPKDDIDRTKGGAYSPTERDNAQDFRNRLLEWLANSNDKEAGNVLRDLITEPELAHLKDWILHLLDRYTENNSESQPWKPQDIRSFAKDFETTPYSDHDLYNITLRRLQDIKHSVEKADISARGDLHEDDDEAIFRSWLTRQLNDQAKGKYKAIQEEEIDLEEKPDIRIETPSISPISLELKWVDGRQLHSLIDDLNSQLVGKYLRAVNSNYGIYVIGYKRKQQKWKNNENDEWINFNQVIEVLKNHAEIILNNHSDIFGLSVISIDFSDPKNI